MKQRVVLGMIFLLSILYGCGFEARKKELEAREQAVYAREQSVMLKEKALQLLEDSLKRNFAKIDSAQLHPLEQHVPLPDSLVGSWSVNMVCTATNCPGFAVGDIRKETWQLTPNEGGVSVRALQGEKLVRVYTGTFNGTTFALSTPEPADSQQASSVMKVDLKVEHLNKLSGQRSITQADGCNALFRVDMDRAKN